MSAVTVLKWRVPVDGSFHPVGSGPVALVEVQNADGAPFPHPVGVVTVWTIESIYGETMTDAVAVGTGQTAPENSEHIGSCQDGSLVWHIFRTAP